MKGFFVIAVFFVFSCSTWSELEDLELPEYEHEIDCSEYKTALVISAEDYCKDKE